MPQNREELQNLQISKLKPGGFVYTENDILIIDDLRNLPKVNSHSTRLDMSVLIACEEGSLNVTIDGKEYNVNRDNLLICSSLHILSSAVTSNDFKCGCIAISNKKLSHLLDGNPDAIRHMLYINDHPLLNVKSNEFHLLPSYRALLKSKLSTLRHKYYNITIENLLRSILFEIIGLNEYKTRSIDEPVKETNTFSSKNAHVRRFLILLAKDNFKHRTVQYFADQLCITSKYLSVVCRQETGKTPNEWIKEKLVERIRYLLLETPLSIKEISNQLGFPNLSFFGKFTKQHLGYPPMEFRKRKEK